LLKRQKEKLMNLVLSRVCKIGKDQGKLCTACYIGWGLIYDGKTFKIDKCHFCSR
jgi:hypothetical protein